MDSMMKTGKLDVDSALEAAFAYSTDSFGVKLEDALVSLTHLVDEERIYQATHKHDTEAVQGYQKIGGLLSTAREVLEDLP